MNDPGSTHSDAQHLPRRPQFSLAALFWLLLTLGMYLAYLRQFSTSIGLLGCGVILLGLGVGALVGLVTRRYVDPIYWSTLVAACAMVSVAGAPGLSFGFRLSWCAVGAACGAACAAPTGRRFVLRIAIGAIVGGVVMGVFVFLVRGQSADNLFDVLTAPIIGALVGGLFCLIRGLELDRRLPHYVVATWLLCAVLAGNFLTNYWLYSR